MAYVTNAGWVDGNATDGLRKCLVEEFSDLYVFHLRGNQRTAGELSRKEGGKIFGAGSRSPIAISVFVKNPDAKDHGRIYFHDIGDYLDRKEKLAIIRDFRSIDGLAAAKAWKCITPDENNDWLDQVDRSFSKFIHIGDKALPNDQKVFELRSRGLETSRDAWAYNASKHVVCQNIRHSINHYNWLLQENKEPETSTRSISWTRGLKKRFSNREKIQFEDGLVVPAIYRPFEKTHVFFGQTFNEYVNQLPRIFPNMDSENVAIAVTGTGASAGFSAYMVSVLPDLNMLSAGAQCFPLYLYEETNLEDGLFANVDNENVLTRRDAITDIGLAHFQSFYPAEKITKEDLFYYIYGLLHSTDYRERFKNNLSKALPRIPAVRTFKDFRAFRDAGRALGNLHVNFESVEPYLVSFREGDHRLINEAEDDPTKFYRVKKMKFGGKGKEKDKTTVIYNENITIENIPLAAYDYVVNGKPALEWVMERQVVKQDKASGIVNDANDYANETVGDPRYPLELFRRVITVSLETMKIVNSLPSLDID